MKIILAGYGKMGKMVEDAAIGRGHEILARIDNEDDWNQAGLEQHPDVIVIEFSQPESAIGNFRRCIQAGLPIVSGTTGWYAKMDEVRSMVEEHDGALLWASNFSIGMNIFFSLNRFMTDIAAQYPQYHASIQEIHHTRKLDQPSGTAITLANDLISGHPAYKAWVNNAQAGSGELSVESIREGDVNGTHIITWQSGHDLIELKHDAFSRRGFAEGAVMAAEWLIGRKGFFEFREVLFGPKLNLV